ncbi:MAG: hypothetical protein K1X64_02955 [Myxococcaceae bacterium]|nr:hypothetical protein [Myxococcaceae bacterium]
MFRVLLTTGLLLPLASAHGSHRRAIRLEYTAPAVCPNKASFEGRLAARLGYNPVSEPATQLVTVAVQVRGELLDATFSLADFGGAQRGDRTFSGAATDCEGVLSGVALALAIALEPLLLTRGPTDAVPPGETHAAVPAQVPNISSASAAPSDVHLLVAVGARGAVGLLPTASAGPSVEVRLRIRSFSVAVDGDVLLAPTVDMAGGRVETSLVRAGVQLCGHVAFASLCARGTGGALAAGGAGFDNSRRGWQPVATFGPLLAARWRPLGGLFLQASLAIDVVLIRSAITLGAVELWNSPVVAGNAALLVGWQFW